MTGKTHLAISAATAAVLLSATGTAPGAPTHVPAGLHAGPDMRWVICWLLVGVVAGLFPDLDVPGSTLEHMPRKGARYLERHLRRAHRFSPLKHLASHVVHIVAFLFTFLLSGISSILRAFTGHRGFTHTLWGALFFTGLVSLAAFLISGSASSSLEIGILWLCGYSSHLAADACTPTGIPLLWKPPVRSSSAFVPSSLKAYSLVTRDKQARARMFHILPVRLRIRTGSQVDTLFVRWLSWLVFLAALLSYFISQC